MSTETTNGIDAAGEVEIGNVGDMLKGSTALEAIDRASIDIQIATAKAYPRSITKALKEAEELATLDEDTAASCFYSIPRSGKNIEGPSARLAEIMAYSWGNLRVDADIVGEDRTHVTAMGTCMDLEKNVAVRVRVKRRITTSSGQRFNADMIGVTSNAAISIALRNAVFKVIPQAFANRIYRSARLASIGEAGTMMQKRQKAMGWFSLAGVSPEQIFKVLEVEGLDDIGVDHLVTLKGIATAIKDGDASVESVFNPSTKSEGASTLDEALSAAGDLTAEDPVPEEPAPEEEDDGSPPSASQLLQLEELRQKVRGAGDGLTSDQEEDIDETLKQKDGKAVRGWIRDLNVILLDYASGGQGDLLDKEG